MKKVWDCRRTFLATIAMLGLLHLMNKNELKDYSVEVIGLAIGVAGINAMERIKKPKGQDAIKD